MAGIGGVGGFKLGVGCQQGLAFAGKHKGLLAINALEPGIYKRLDAHSVACAEQGSFFGVPEGKGPHAVKAVQAVLAPGIVGFQQDLGVRIGLEANPLRLQFVAQLQVVVDFAVKHHHMPRVGVVHGLVGTVAQVNNA